MKFSIAATALLSLASAGEALKTKISSKKLQRDMKEKKLMKNLEDLNDIAFANGGNRAFGYAGYDASVDYVFERISKYRGAKAWKQDFPALFNQVESISLEIDGEELYVYGLTYSPSTSEEGITAPMILGPEGEAGCSESSYDDLDVEGKIVLTQRFVCPDGTSFAGRMLPAAARGAAAVIIYNNVETNSTAGTLSEPNPEEYVPTGLINLVDGTPIAEKLAAGEAVEAYFQQTQVIETRTTQNVFVETEEGDPENVIVLGAHLDSVPAGPGINDDGSGSSLLLELSEAVMHYKFKNKLRFAWWGAEEIGLVGSDYYCSNLKAEEVNKILAYLNYDMVSKGYFGIGDTDGTTGGVVAPAGSETIESIYTEWFKSEGLETVQLAITNGSDYASFWERLNKPFGYLNTGTAPAQDPCYHQACDTIENPEPETIHTNARAAAHMVATLAMDGTELIPKTPVNATMLGATKNKILGVDPLMMHELEAMGERHMGCGHDV